MKDTETKRAFIEARAEGLSYRAIQEKLGISKATCSNWEKALSEEIEAFRSEKLEELYSSYAMTREARIESLGNVIDRIDEARANMRESGGVGLLENLPEDKLLELRLKYDRELHSMYREPVRRPASDNTLDGIIEEYNALLSEAQTGKYTASQVKAQLSILDAKRDTLFKKAIEEMKEEDNIGDFSLVYTSKLLRHEEDAV